MLIGAGFIDDERVEALEERFGLLSQPLDGVSVGDVGVGVLIERRGAHVSRSHHNFERRGELLEVGRPGAAQQGLWREDESAAGLFLAPALEGLDGDEGLPRSRVTGIKHDVGGEVVFEGLELMCEGFGHLTPTEQCPEMS